MDPEEELEHEEAVFDVPEFWMEDEDVELSEFQYSTRHPDDWVISGPLTHGTGPGRRFPSWKKATEWAREFYGVRLRGRVAEVGPDSNRWAFLIRGPRGPLG